MANKKTFSYKDQSVEHLIEVLREERESREKIRHSKLRRCKTC